MVEMTAKAKILAHYQQQIELAQDRIDLFETDLLGAGDLGFATDTTLQSIAVEREIVVDFQRAIEILRKA
jgi:lipid II:glycine glycyltransferase (peptidoglycan interpeptide bridge formation enzyme)